ncbi:MULTISPECIES: DNA adenine methylase [Bacillus]|uniref:site-specific DNA-methyltransferase (adenine-specific) n=1 Tax=Bacillus glycinifermentans TaxID=1664069 RepID=A0AAJ3Z461_9BACI|nr:MULTISPECIES: DNA adenine methylase [Bacillus]KKB74064.1 DNA methyltransferase [Bacillus sp. TH008]MDU0070175.1 DNA adenine methylase [Bacillus sp. IG6]MED8017891.1 DNA adenine methylase [Bacillus glycinifermentans]QAT67670.1 DNA adenine methylase [Bacillus glycinifermentans]WKB77332.1 DNA adenine methylase [Bacillus glycinifermentans]
MPRTLSPLRYPGGKTQLYKFVKKLIEQNNILLPIYVEPFAGGAGLAIELLLRGDVNSIIINDFDPAIYNFWKCVLYDTDNFVNLIEETPINISEWEKQKEIYNNQLNYSELEVGFATFYLNRTNRSGIIKGGPISRDNSGKYKLDCRFNKVDLINKIRHISLVKDSINLYNYDAIFFIKHILPIFPEQQLFIFFDPPYYEQGKNLYTNFYTHNDHEELCNAIKEISESHWITTYDFNQAIANLYKDVPTKVYQLHYSANRKRKEKEFLFHNIKTRVDSFEKVQFVES